MTNEHRCHTCKRTFSTYRGLGQHMRHARAAIGKGKRNRICPDRRDDEEARETALRITRLRGKLGLGAFAGGRRG